MARRIILIVPSDRIGGAESNLKKICKYFLVLNAQVEVIFISQNDMGGWNELRSFTNLNLVYLNTRNVLFGFLKCFLYLLKKRVNTARVYDYSFTSHTHCNAFISFCEFIGFLKIKRIVLRESTNVFSWFKGYKLALIKLLYLFYSKKSLIICQTPRMENELLANINRLKNNMVKVIPNPVDLNTLHEKSSIDFSDNVDILAVGRIVPEKAYDVLLQAFKLVLDIYPDRRLTIIGDGAEYAKVAQQVIDLNLSESVVLKGALENPCVYMKHANVSVISSRLEGFPNVLFEMMALSNTVVSTLCADGIDELPGIYVAPTNDPVCLGNVIVQAIEQDIERKQNNVLLMRAKVASLSIDNFIDDIKTSITSIK